MFSLFSVDANFLEGLKLVLFSILTIFRHLQIVVFSEGSWESLLICLGLPLGREDDLVPNNAVFDVGQQF